MQNPENAGYLFYDLLSPFIKTGLLSEPKDKMFLASLTDQQTLAALHLSPSLLTSVGYKYTVITSLDDDPEDPDSGFVVYAESDLPYGADFPSPWKDSLLDWSSSSITNFTEVRLALHRKLFKDFC